MNSKNHDWKLASFKQAIVGYFSSKDRESLKIYSPSDKFCQKMEKVSRDLDGWLTEKGDKTKWQDLDEYFVITEKGEEKILVAFQNGTYYIGSIPEALDRKLEDGDIVLYGYELLDNMESDDHLFDSIKDQSDFDEKASSLIEEAFAQEIKNVGGEVSFFDDGGEYTVDSGDVEQDRIVFFCVPKNWDQN